MCGINGYVGRPRKGSEKQFRAFMDALMVETMTRGPHATGCASWISGSRSIIGKGPVDATNFIKTPVWERALDGQAMIGHCRYATHGSPSKNENNHPFEHGRWALVHNGVISSYRAIQREEKVNLTTECDSEIILRVFAKHAGKGDAIKGLQGWLDAAGHSSDYAVAVLDRTNGNVYILRDDGRPCSILRLPHLGIVAFASTKDILARAFDKMFDTYKDDADLALYEDAETWDCLRDRVYILRPDRFDVETVDLKVKEQTFEQKVYGFSRPHTSTGVWEGSHGGVMEVCPRCGQPTCECGRLTQYSGE